MKFIRVIKARWDSDSTDTNFTSFQEHLKNELEEYGDIRRHLEHLCANLYDLEEYLDPYMLNKCNFLNSRIKKLLLSAFSYKFETSQDFWEDLGSILYLASEDMELTTQSEYKEPNSIEQFISSLESTYDNVKQNINLIRKDIEQIPDYGSKVYKTGVLRDIDKFENKISTMITKCFDYLDQEYGIK